MVEVGLNQGEGRERRSATGGPVRAGIHAGGGLP